MGHSGDTLVGHSVGHSVWDTLVGHLWVTLAGSSCGAPFWDTLDTTNHLLTSDTPRLRQHVSRSPVARRHANALSTKAAQIPMALRHHERRLATRSAQTLEARMSHDTTYNSSHSPATRRVYASMFCAPQWHGTTQRHFPPSPRKSQWHCDVTNVACHERRVATRSAQTL